MTTLSAVAQDAGASASKRTPLKPHTIVVFEGPQHAPFRVVGSVVASNDKVTRLRVLFAPNGEGLRKVHYSPLTALTSVDGDSDRRHSEFLVPTFWIKGVKQTGQKKVGKGKKQRWVNYNYTKFVIIPSMASKVFPQTVESLTITVQALFGIGEAEAKTLVKTSLQDKLPIMFPGEAHNEQDA